MATPETTHYEVLGVPKTASQEEIKKAYRKLLPKVHPDTGGTDAIFRITQTAYETLGDPESRIRYDRELETNFERKTVPSATPPTAHSYTPPRDPAPRPRAATPPKSPEQQAKEREMWARAAKVNNGANVRTAEGGTKAKTPNPANVELKPEYWKLVNSGVPLKKVLRYRTVDRIVTIVWLLIILTANYLLFNITLTGPSNEDLFGRIFNYIIDLAVGNLVLFGLSILSGVIIRVIRRRFNKYPIG